MQSSRLIIGIHGLANKPPREEKQGWWKASILEGLRRNCGRDEPDLPFTFVYWADLRYDAPLDEDHNLEPYYPDAGTGPFPTKPDDAPNAEKVALVERFARAVEWVQEKTGLTPIDEALIEYRLDDLQGYLKDAAFRVAARGRLREALEEHSERDVLLVAHSMGALIAYDVLRIMEREGRRPGVAHLVTIGAPLGLAEVKLRMREEHGDLVVPETLPKWSNLMDRADVATFGQDIGESYAPNRRGVRAADVAVVNAYRRPRGDINHHKSYGYLRTPQFSQAVAAFLDGEAAVAGDGAPDARAKAAE